MEQLDSPLPSSQFDTLMRRARTGDGDALGRLMESCRHFLSVVADRRLGVDLRPKVGGSDLVQKTFLDVQKDFEQFQGGSPAELHAWMERILLHNLADCARQYRQTEKRALDREVSLDYGSTPAHLASDDSTPSKKVIAREEREELFQAIKRLPEDYRRVILLRNQDKHSFEEIGRILNRSTEAAKKLWGRAILHLEKELSGHEPPQELQ